MDKNLDCKGRWRNKTVAFRVSEEEGKLICEQVVPFEDVPKELWLQFSSIEEFQKQLPQIEPILLESDGKSAVVIYCRKENARKRMGENYAVFINDMVLHHLSEKIGEKNVKVVQKSIEKTPKKY